MGKKSEGRWAEERIRWPMDMTYYFPPSFLLSNLPIIERAFSLAGQKVNLVRPNFTTSYLREEMFLRAMKTGVKMGLRAPLVDPGCEGAAILAIESVVTGGAVDDRKDTPSARFIRSLVVPGMNALRR